MPLVRTCVVGLSLRVAPQLPGSVRAMCSSTSGVASTTPYRLKQTAVMIGLA